MIRRAVEGLGDKRPTISCSPVHGSFAVADELCGRWETIAARKVQLTEV